MNIDKEEEQRQEFRNILFSLAESQIALKDRGERSKIYQRLEKLYYMPEREDNYRHFYSDIFLVLTQIQQGNMPGNIEILGQNILEIRKGYHARNYDESGQLIDISDNIKKLYDHVSLDIARLSYSDAMNWKNSGEAAIAELDRQMNELKLDINSANDTQVEIEASIKNQQKEYITILGIFAAIILAFVGGITFSSSILEHIHLATIYRLLLVVDFLAFVLINLVYLLINSIFAINGTDIEFFKIKSFNWICLGIAIVAIIGWIFNIRFLPGYSANFLPWCK